MIGAESTIRAALRERVMAETAGAKNAVDEFWVPRSHERADLAVIGRWMDGFEIKTERDTLRRLPRQVEAYTRLFDRCTAVVANKHSERAADMLPAWWGITTVHVNGSVTFTSERKPRTNQAVDPEVIVRLLWREEAFDALCSLGAEPDPRSPRNALWHALLHAATLAELRRLVRHALIGRDPARARIATRRFTPTDAVPVAGR
jgi:hypothetical protein